jgi:hypothetical protein
MTFLEPSEANALAAELAEAMTAQLCHCGSPARMDGSDYDRVCTQWPLCEQPRGQRWQDSQLCAVDGCCRYRFDTPTSRWCSYHTENGYTR